MHKYDYVIWQTSYGWRATAEVYLGHKGRSDSDFLHKISLEGYRTRKAAKKALFTFCKKTQHPVEGKMSGDM